jgi:hypothetical protein
VTAIHAGSSLNDNGTNSGHHRHSSTGMPTTTAATLLSIPPITTGPIRSSVSDDGTISSRARKVNL